MKTAYDANADSGSLAFGSPNDMRRPGTLIVTLSCNRLSMIMVGSATALLGLACLGWATSAVAASPPIDCRKAQHDVDREICASPEFVAMDHEIVALYDRGIAQFSGGDRHKLALSQVAFVRKRNGCDWAAHHSAHPGVAVEECVRGAMEARIRSLREIVDRGRF